MKKRFFLLAALLMISFGASAQYDPQMPLPINPDIKTGKLKNGLTYYILHNEEPKNRADFYIIYSVGALQENDEQNGLAHFLEHMAFNGTKNFPGGNSDATSIVKTLERHGLAFGRNINAYTTYDRTVYHLDGVPTTDEKLIDTCLLVLHDWAHYVSLEAEEIDNERGVISEEWRTRNNADARVRKQWFPVIFGDTKYSTHDVIGDYDIINSFKYDELRQFYYDWYRTDQQAVAVVGDVDVAQIEKKIEEVFSSIPAVENPKQKEEIVLPENKEPQYVLATDKEQTRTIMQIMMVQKTNKLRTVGDMRKKIIDELYNAMIGQRLNEINSKGEAKMVTGGASNGTLIGDYGAYTMMLVPKTGLECEGLEIVYTEALRAQRHGFLQSELDRVKSVLLTALENSYKQKDKISNGQLIGELVSLFAYGDISIKIDDYYAIRKALINDIKIEEVNKVAAGYPTFKNTKIILMGDDKWNAPGKDQILAVFAKVDADKENIQPYEEEKLAETISDKPIVPGKIVKEKELPLFGAKQWTLSNGAKVVYTKADYNKDIIKLNSNSWGGKSLYKDNEVITVDLAGMFGGMLGLGKFNGEQLDKFLRGKHARSGIKLDTYSEAVTGESNVKDFELMMQLVNLRFTDPNFDENTFKNMVDRLSMVIEMLNRGPAHDMTDSLKMIISNYNERAKDATPADMRALKLDDVKKYYLERITDGSDFTFFITGELDESAVKPAVEKYLASIPSTYRKEQWKDDKVTMPKGQTVRKVYIPFETPKASVAVIYHNKLKVTPKSRLELSVLSSILRTRYITNIREKEGGTYGVSVNGSVSTIPVKDAVLMISFETEPSKAEHLKSLVFAELDKVIAEGVTEDEVTNVVKNMLKEREQKKKTNDFVASSVEKYVLEGIDYSDPKNYEDILNKMKPADIQSFAKKFLSKKADCVDIIFSTDKN